MKAIILAAGLGQRMGVLTKEIPKPLLTISNKSLLEYKIQNLRHSGFKDKDIILVVGHLGELIISSFPTLTFINNPDYASSNNMYSLWLAREHTADGFFLFNADTIYCKKIYQSAFDCSEESFVLVDSTIKDSHDLGVVIDKNNKVREIDFHLPIDSIFGKGLQISKFSKRDAELFIAFIKESLDYGLFQKGVNIIQREWLLKMHLSALDVQGLPWTEIDLPEDLKKAEEILNQNETF